MLKYSKLVLFFLIGMVMLNLFSLIQKIFVLQSIAFALDPSSYIAPSIFGGMSGIIIGFRGLKIQDLNNQLRIRVADLEKILPICSVCKKICNNPGASAEDRIWIDVVEYLAPRTFSHGFCPACYKETLKNLD